jgi:gamma-glutamyltranspeptidase/glutathione hydrolase
VPGTVAGLALALKRYGSLSLPEVIAPALALATHGITVSRDLADSLARRRDRLAANPAAAAVFLKPDGRPYEAGERLIQSDLAWTLKQIGAGGEAAFYTGPIGQRIAADMSAHGGLLDGEDLAAYRAVLRAPVRGSYRGYEIYAMPPPSSGGVHLAQMLNVLEDFPLAFLGHNSADTIHLLAETMKLAYADRSEYLGDPDYWAVPSAGLTSKHYAATLREHIDLDRARPSSQIRPGRPPREEGPQTTHFSVMDGAGNVVSNTYTINFSYGSGIVAAGTGVLLNNEMDDFSAKPGIPNAYGLVGGEANAVAGGKRPLSSMTPTIVLRGDEPFLATGSPGGSRIITTVLQLLLNVIDHRMNVAEATAAPRVHHQWLPDELRVEEGLSPDTIDRLEAKGHRVVVKNAMGSTQTIMRLEGRFLGASDPRRAGALTLGY